MRSERLQTKRHLPATVDCRHDCRHNTTRDVTMKHDESLPMRPMTYVAIDTRALARNLRLVRTRLAERVRLMAVVKANAYGHGLKLAAHAFAEAGADWLGVSTLDEGIRLRQHGLQLPVLLFLPALDREVEPLVEHRLTGTVVACDQVPVYAEAARKLGHEAGVHVYTDAGLGRLGSDDSLPDLLTAAASYPRVTVTGVYTHFGPGGSGTMLEGLDALRPGASARAFGALAQNAVAGAGLGRVSVHCAASELLLSMPETHFDMVRAGTLLYGQLPPGAADDAPALQKTFELRSHIVAIHSLPKGSPVGYGGEFVTGRDSRIATVPVGLAHGLGVTPESLGRSLRQIAGSYLRRRRARRGISDRGPWGYVRDQQVPVVGRISMDQCCLDVTATDAQVGDEVALDTRRVTTSAAIPRIAVEL